MSHPARLAFLFLVAPGLACVTVPVKQEAPDAPWSQRFRGKEPGGESERPVVVDEPKADTPEHTVTNGAQLNANLAGSTGGIALSTELGYGNSRFSISLAPSLAWGAVRSTSEVVATVALTSRIFFSERSAGQITGFFRPEVLLGSLASFGSGSLGISPQDIGGGAGLFGGAEYLVSRHLGITIETGGKMLTNGTAVAFVFGGAVGIMLHN